MKLIHNAYYHKTQIKFELWWHQFHNSKIMSLFNGWITYFSVSNYNPKQCLQQNKTTKISLNLQFLQRLHICIPWIYWHYQLINKSVFWLFNSDTPTMTWYIHTPTCVYVVIININNIKSSLSLIFDRNLFIMNGNNLFEMIYLSTTNVYNFSNITFYS